ncbi:beta-ketoacyl synthase N-terminal-like domain-containing protein [Nocardia sp. NPDC050175]|uniref:beta-ketoacyl synthase N-terminal-like domain-containing protein n=1 Tax=Nocardia sp. NPDC050175 TaxID=3364317 RepID=UPI003791CE99
MASHAGVRAIVHPDTYLQARTMRMLAADGRCETFDAEADGFLLSPAPASSLVPGGRQFATPYVETIANCRDWATKVPVLSQISKSSSWNPSIR